MSSNVICRQTAGSSNRKFEFLWVLVVCCCCIRLGFKYHTIYWKHFINSELDQVNTLVWIKCIKKIFSTKSNSRRHSCINRIWIVTISSFNPLHPILPLSPTSLQPRRKNFVALFFVVMRWKKERAWHASTFKSWGCVFGIQIGQITVSTDFLLHSSVIIVWYELNIKWHRNNFSSITNFSMQYGKRMICKLFSFCERKEKKKLQSTKNESVR